MHHALRIDLLDLPVNGVVGPMRATSSRESASVCVTSTVFLASKRVSNVIDNAAQSETVSNQGHALE